MKINIIVAFSKNRGIGFNNTLPWNIPSDLKKFRDLTIGDDNNNNNNNNNNAVIMGKNTWNSLPVKYLKKRDNLILSNTLKLDIISNNNIIKSFNTINDLLKFCTIKNYDNLWIIGGTQIYKEFMENNIINIDKIFVTYIDNIFECDTYFPNIDENIFYIESNNLHNTNNLISEYKIYDIIYCKKYNIS